jgi:hypothetical protein
MGNLFVSLLPLIVGAAVVPIWIIMVLFLLRSEGGLLKATAFAAGSIAVRVVQGVLFGYIFNAAEEANPDSGQGIIVAILLLIVGILMLITAVKQWRKEDDPDVPPKWMAMISGLTAVKAFGMGALLVAIAAKQWVFTLSAIGVIGEAQLSQVSNIFAFIFYVLAAQSLVLAPIVVSVVAPTQSAKTLEMAQGWLERHNRVIVILVSSVFGVYFLWKGFIGLIG